MNRKYWNCLKAENYLMKIGAKAQLQTAVCNGKNHQIDFKKIEI